MFSLTFDPEKTTPQRAAQFTFEYERALEALYQQSQQPVAISAPVRDLTVQEYLDRFDRHDGGVMKAQREAVIDLTESLGGRVVPRMSRKRTSDNRAYLRLLFGPGRDDNFGYMSSRGIMLVGSRHLDSVDGFIRDGYIETVNARAGKDHQYPLVEHRYTGVIAALMREFAAKRAVRPAA